jgi:hypothetical protein
MPITEEGRAGLCADLAARGTAGTWSVPIVSPLNWTL